MKKTSTLEERIARTKAKLAAMEAQGAKRKADQHGGVPRKIARAARLLRALEKDLEGDLAAPCGALATILEVHLSATQLVETQVETLPFEAVASQDE